MTLWTLAQRAEKMNPSVIREILKVTEKPGIISFAGGLPSPRTFPVEAFAQACARVLETDGRSALQYAASEGYRPLCEWVAHHLPWDVSADQVLITTGSQQGLDLIGKVLAEPGAAAIVEAPTFLATIQCFRLYGADLISVPIDADGVRVDELEKLIQQHRPRFVYLIPTFGNPSGAMLTRERRKRVLELAVQYQTVVVEDDPYGELYFDAPPPPSLLALSHEVPGSRDWLIHCGSLSKILSPGLRLGWMVAPPALLSRAVMCKQFSDAHTSTFAQAVAARYLANGGLPAALQNARAIYGSRARVMCQGLRDELGAAVDFVAPRGGFFVWAHLTGAGGGPRDSTVFARTAIERGVAFVPGAPFFSSNPDPSTFRLSFATAGEDQIREGVHRLAAALAG